MPATGSRVRRRPHGDSPDDGGRAERSALLGSLLTASVMGLGAVTWGVLARAQVLVFDGVYMLAGIALVAVSLLAAHVSRAAPNAHYPYGRHAATPLAVAMQGIALLATVIYGVFDAASTILAGGSPAAPVALMTYGTTTAAGSLVIASWIRRRAPGSDLAGAEVVTWHAGALLSTAVALGGVVALVLSTMGLETASSYVDPALVLVASAVLAPLPVSLLREGMHEVLEGSSPAAVDADIAEAVEAVRQEFALPEPHVRSTKLGRRLYVDVTVVVPTGAWAVEDADRVRRAVSDRLAVLPYDVQATVILTTDPSVV